MVAFMCILMDAFFIALLIWCGIVDMKKRIVPNAAIVLLLCLGIVHLCLMATSRTWWTYPAGLIFAVPYFILWLKDGIGAGDVKLLMVLGLYLGLLEQTGQYGYRKSTVNREEINKPCLECQKSDALNWRIS